MDDKARTEIREYRRGYEDGLNDKTCDDGSDAFVTLITLGMGGGPREGASEYHNGYRDGQEDRKR